MSSAAPAEVQAAAEDQNSIAAILRARWDAIKSGDVGSLPVIIGIIAITLFFTSKTSLFFSAVNFQNLIGQMAGVTVIAIGVVFVLLIGEIDLSVGYVSGIAGVAVAYFQQAGTGHRFPGLVALALAILAGLVIGLIQGSVIAFIGVPSFVVTLAGLLVAEACSLLNLGSKQRSPFGASSARIAPRRRAGLRASRSAPHPVWLLSISLGSCPGRSPGDRTIRSTGSSATALRRRSAATAPRRRARRRR